MLQTAWLVAASPLVASGVIRASVLPSIICMAGWTLLALGTVLLWRRSHLGLVLSSVIAAVVVLGTVPWAIYNYWAFATRDARYVDSPATILVVGIACLVTAVPAAAVLLLSVGNRSRVARSPGV